MSKISIIVPVYNVEKYLERCVTSLTNQTYRNVEIILVDDGSTDSSGDICDVIAKKDSRIRVIHKINGGLSDARNVGIEASTGDFIGFVDSDDWVDTDMYRVLLKNIEHTNADVSDIDMVLTSTEYKYENKAEKISVFYDKEILKDYFLSDRYSCCRKLYKKSIIGGTRFPVGKINEDIATNFLFLKEAKSIVKSSLKMYYYFRNPESITGRVFKKKDLDLLDACDNLFKYASFDKEIARLAKIKYASAYYSLIGRYICYENVDFENADRIVNGFQKNLRKYYWLLMHSYVSFKKKILITVLCTISPKNLKLLNGFINKYIQFK